MQYYQDLTIIKSPDISPYFIWSKLYTQLHLALVELQHPNSVSEIGVSFPEYQYIKENNKTIMTLGCKLRIFSHKKEMLEQLNISHWLERLKDYVHILSIQNVPSNVTEHLVVKRLRQRTNNDKYTRDYAKKHNLSFEEAKEARVQRFMEVHNVTLQESLEHYENPVLKRRPFIIMQSLRTKQQYSLEIEQLRVNGPVAGAFSSYGLSSTTTVPAW
ncbi:type I-F CRISPR-associated endoribonuclease Cas6/Csy4 [Testudinibacter aquarius]|uniref:CRISPR-associated endonuclease Csy4 n=1 Tax=Testudinibacter aquarius TaxID=1524974 RepID=A0A4R3Y7V4_9PAST|nr:type I-F CRISPR-associated endoribonuclease Cas6/Csy4 [Testudinibacter aquarius]KAE9530174.1 hypothetical protein A1D24_06805 [Testudinibacter aquarius]TCV87957.1 CRISPR-associated endonuclease Csy4 [Testudinibacter aquarius]TNG90235.1 type I-F CRISPR-associated endoribonuclease Cas6/Csy4 [Testudinibacter aquarius]